MSWGQAPPENLQLIPSYGHIGDEIPYIPNKKAGGVCIGGKIAPIFFNTMEDAGALPFECDVDQLNTETLLILMFMRAP